MPRDALYPEIGDYALVGDTRTAALIARDGSVEWYCLPIFDSPSIFAAILDRSRGGAWMLRPAGDFSADRRYLDGTNVLETTFHADTGSISVRDALVVAPPDGRTARLAPEHELLRVVTGIGGTVEVETRLEPRPGYGQRAARLRDRGSYGVGFEADGQSVTLLADMPVQVSADGASAYGTTTISDGDTRRLSLVSDRVAPAVFPPLGEHADRRMEETGRWWTGWSAATRYDGPYRDAVARSALALKLMVFSPSGATIAAPTTSLPEEIGGSANWDYRYCWLRDAAFTIRALYEVGHDQEADSFLAWLLHATRVTLPELQVVYDVYGETHLVERELELAGYAGSRPVRVGNQATEQFQLDVYGEVIDAAVRYARQGGLFDTGQERMLAELGETVCRRWETPDHGIWEIRGEPRQYTHSKMLGWVALDRLLELEARGACEVDHDRILRNRELLHEAIETRGYSDELGGYVGTFDGRDVDAGVLSALLHGYGSWDSGRTHGTVDLVERHLADGPLVYRYRPGGGRPNEGTFGAVAFWLVECLARIGRVDDARRRFDALLAHANDLGLYAEEIEAGSGLALGNFPQALTHIGLINAATTLERAS